MLIKIYYYFFKFFTFWFWKFDLNTWISIRSNSQQNSQQSHDRWQVLLKALSSKVYQWTDWEAWHNSEGGGQVSKNVVLHQWKS